MCADCPYHLDKVNEDTCTCNIETSTCELRMAVPWTQLRTVAHPHESGTEVEANPEEPETDETVGLVVSAFGISASAPSWSFYLTS